MPHLKHYTGKALEELRSSVEKHLDWYYNQEGPAPSIEPPGGVRGTQTAYEEFADGLLVNPERRSGSDAQNALAVYGALSVLTPHQASIERMWAYVCHCVCPDYVTQRWLSDGRSEKREVDVQRVLNHFFAVGNRALVRDNGISRLWWLGKIANDVDNEDPLRFLTILLHRQDVRSALIERPSVSMNRRVLRGIYSTMQEHWENGGALFERETFRSWMVALNRRGGVVLLDALPDADLVELLRGEAYQALERYADGQLKS